MLRDFAVPLRTLDPADLDVSDLEWVRELVGAARVVAIGESAHGVREFYQLKDRLLRFLVSELGFTAFVMESGFPEGLAVDDWVLGGDGDLDDIARTGITYRFGECEEMRAQLRWMRDWNAAHERKVRFYGMDIPGSGATLGPAIRACLARLPARPDDAALLALAGLGAHLEGITRYLTTAPAEQSQLSAGLDVLLERARTAGDEIAVRCALSAQCLAELAALRFQTREGSNLRDELMSDTVRWILKRGERVVIGAHNAHAQRLPFHGRPMLGQLLTPALGTDLVIVGTTYASGDLVHFRANADDTGIAEVSLEALQPPPHTIDAQMDAVGFPLHGVDLRRVTQAQGRVAGTMMINHEAFELAPQDAFDALIHVRHVSAVAGLLEASREALARANAKA